MNANFLAIISFALIAGAFACANEPPKNTVVKCGYEVEKDVRMELEFELENGRYLPKTRASITNLSSVSQIFIDDKITTASVWALFYMIQMAPY